MASLGPRPPPFWSPICIHNNTQNRRSFVRVYYCERKQKVKMGEAWERGYIMAKTTLESMHKSDF